MQEASDNFLQATPMDAEFKEYFPEEWQDLPIIPQSVTLNDDGSGTQCLAFMLRCKSETATADEIQTLVHKIQQVGEPVAWLCKLACIVVPVFPEGKDPTVKEFFESEFSKGDMTTNVVLVAYPHFDAALLPKNVSFKNPTEIK